ncbi:MAG TPA: NUDIX domain-containing protein [Steroidobacteraceae bacterium]|nr:NUDIX domain-containing protein [Steroidobacteraceae bacterium]
MGPRIHSAGVVVVRRVDDDWRVLLLRVYDYWDCPKGEVAAGEDQLATARREVREETGIDDLDFRWGTEFTETAPYSKNKVARYYLAATATARVELPVNPGLGAPEHHEFRWLRFSEAKTLAVPRIAAVLDWAAARLD